MGGDSRETWAADLESGTVNWLDESLPRDLHRRVRVLTYGYSTRLFSDAAIGLRNKATALTTHDDRALQYLPQALDIHSRRLTAQLTALRGVLAGTGQSFGSVMVWVVSWSRTYLWKLVQQWEHIKRIKLFNCRPVELFSLEPR